MLATVLTVAVALLGLSPAQPPRLCVGTNQGRTAEVLAGFGPVQRAELKIVHTRPSMVLGIIKTGEWGEPVFMLKDAGDATLPMLVTEDGIRTPMLQGVEIWADDARRRLLVKGPKEKIRLLRNYVQSLDVARPKVRLVVRLRSPLPKLDATYSAQTEDRTPWTMRAKGAGLTLSLTPRINGDGTVTLFAHYTYGKASVQTVVRIQQQESLLLADSGWSLKGEPLGAAGFARVSRADAELEWKGPGQPTPYFIIQATPIAEPKGRPGAAAPRPSR